MRYHSKQSLLKYNSFRLKSVANHLWLPENVEELASLFASIPEAQIIADGTNILLSPVINQVICLNKMPSYILQTDNNFVVSANCKTQKFVNLLTKLNISGIETLYGIPGTIGGAIVMNAGSKGIEISKHLNSVTVLTNKKQIKVYTKKQLNFKRRYSILQTKKKLVLSASFCFPKKEINRKLLKETIEYRKTLPKQPSAGGIFLNWYLLKDYSDKLKNLSYNDAQVSKCINIIVNNGNASYRDVIRLISKIMNIVSYKLKLEIKLK